MPPSEAVSENSILRLSAIGDVTHGVPVVRATQGQLPNANITWVCGKLLEHNVVAGPAECQSVYIDRTEIEQGVRKPFFHSTSQAP